MSLLKPPPSNTPQGNAPAGAQMPAAHDRAPRWLSSQLLAGQREACIDHEGATYRLRLTSLGKLILTK